jgi:hypothetical protein
MMTLMANWSSQLQMMIREKIGAPAGATSAPMNREIGGSTEQALAPFR